MPDAADAAGYACAMRVKDYDITLIALFSPLPPLFRYAHMPPLARYAARQRRRCFYFAIIDALFFFISPLLMICLRLRLFSLP